jgi:hypothetical protein
MTEQALSVAGCLLAGEKAASYKPQAASKQPLNESTRPLILHFSFCISPYAVCTPSPVLINQPNRAAILNSFQDLSLAVA